MHQTTNTSASLMVRTVKSKIRKVSKVSIRSHHASSEETRIARGVAASHRWDWQQWAITAL